MIRHISSGLVTLAAIVEIIAENNGIRMADMCISGHIAPELWNDHISIRETIQQLITCLHRFINTLGFSNVAIKRINGEVGGKLWGNPVVIFRERLVKIPLQCFG